VSSASGPAGAAPTSTSSASITAAPAPIQTKMTKKNDDGRYVFECNGRKIYEWDQTLEGTCVEEVMRFDLVVPVLLFVDCLVVSGIGRILTWEYLYGMVPTIATDMLSIY
jgi:hypothetical protein